MITARCECGKEYRVGLDKAGKRFKCRECGQTLQVPDTGEEFAAELDEYAGVDAGWESQLPPRVSKQTGQKTSKKSASARQSETALPPVVRSRKKKKKKSTGGARKKPAKRSGGTVANGLRIVLAGLLLQVTVFLAVMVPGVAQFGFVILLLNLIATLLALTGQAMCLAAPSESGTRPLIVGVIGLQVASLSFRVATLLNLRLSVAFALLSMLASIAAFFLFVYALKRLASFAGSPTGEMHAEWILHWGGGLVCLTFVPAHFGRTLGAGVVGPLVWVVRLASLAVCALMLLRYIDLLGCLKEELEVA